MNTNGVVYNPIIIPIYLFGVWNLGIVNFSLLIAKTDAIVSLQGYNLTVERYLIRCVNHPPMPKSYLPIAIILFVTGCSNKPLKNETGTSPVHSASDSTPRFVQYDSTFKTIHVLVALCDNKYQGIVPVPAKIGNGQDPENNLYWGCSAGVRSYFKNSKNWILVKRYKINEEKLERVVFRHKSKLYFLIADAYNGKEIKLCTTDFFKSCAGIFKDTLHIDGHILGINGNARLVCYIGHDGLMDFSLPTASYNADNKKRDAIMLACISKKYFAGQLKATGANPLLWSTGLMSPEAYTLHDAIDGYIDNETAEKIRIRGAKAYAHYQKCGEKAAMNLLVSGY